MREPTRIFKFCNELAKIWREYAPDWRFGQLMMNVLGAMQASGKDPFFPEEDEMLQFFKDYFNTPGNTPYKASPDSFANNCK